MNELLTGLVGIVCAAWLYRFLTGGHQYKNSIQKALYSGYLEFYLKKNRLRRLSVSIELQGLFGKHRIHYQLFTMHGKEELQPYIVVALSSGLYFIKVMNSQGRITNAQEGSWLSVYAPDKKKPEQTTTERLGNPLAQVREFDKKMHERLSKFHFPSEKIIVFPDSCELNVNDSNFGDVNVTKRSSLLETMKKLHEAHDEVLADAEIDAVWIMMAQEGLALEE